MRFRTCDPLGTHDEFIGLGLLRKEHLYKGPQTGQEDGSPLQDGCSLEAGSKMGYQLLQVYPPPNPVR